MDVHVLPRFGWHSPSPQAFADTLHNLLHFIEVLNGGDIQDIPTAVSKLRLYGCGEFHQVVRILKRSFVLSFQNRFGCYGDVTSFRVIHTIRWCDQLAVVAANLRYRVRSGTEDQQHAKAFHDTQAYLSARRSGEPSEFCRVGRFSSRLPSACARVSGGQL